MAEVAEVDGRYASHPDQHEIQLLAALTPYGNSYGSGPLRAKAAKNGGRPEKRARGRPEKTGANGPGRLGIWVQIDTLRFFGTFLSDPVNVLVGVIATWLPSSA